MCVCVFSHTITLYIGSNKMDYYGYWIYYCFNHVASTASDSLSTDYCIVCKSHYSSYYKPV